MSIDILYVSRDTVCRSVVVPICSVNTNLNSAKINAALNSVKITINSLKTTLNNL